MEDEEYSVVELEGNWAYASFPKRCVCVLPIRDLLRYLPQEVLIAGFRRGKSFRRSKALQDRLRGGLNAS